MEFEHNGEKYVFSNAMEEEVVAKVRSTIKSDEGMCKCIKCFYDACAIALNNIGIAKYSTSHQGALMSKMSSAMNMETVGIVSVEVIKAVNMVKDKPNH